MSLSSGSDRIVFEEQPQGPAGPAGPPGPAGNPYRTRTAGTNYTKGQAARLSAGQYVVALAVDQIDGVFGNTGLAGSMAQVYPNGALLDVTGVGLASGDLYAEENTGNLVPYSSLVPGTDTRYMGFCDSGSLLSVQIDDSFTVPTP